MARGKENWIAVSKSKPCPICGKPDNCKISRDRGAVFCGRVPSNKQPNAGGQWLHILSNSSGYSHPVLGDAPPAQTKPKSTAKPIKTTDWDKNVDHFCSQGKESLPDLAIQLGVDVEVLRRLRVGRVKDDRNDFWTVPERDADGKIIGVVRRYSKTGKKFAFKDCNRGLTYCDDWDKTPGPIYLVEGHSDTAALMTMGCCVVGRPSNSGGTDQLIELLKHQPNRQIIVLGEHDQKENGTWPGRAGAISTAKGLSAGLGRPIDWALPPAGYKDVRAYLTSEEEKPPWELDLNTIEPPPPPEPYRPPVGEQRSLVDWRKELTDARLEALKEPGIYFDGSPTGAGKSFADRVAMEKAGKSLTLLPTHQNGDELVHELKEAGLDAAKLPARASPEMEEDYLAEQQKKPRKVPWNYGVCQNFSEAKKAESFGLSVGAAVCPTCKFREDCNYLEVRKEAMDSPHLVVTHHMFAHSSQDLSKNRKYIAIHEDAEQAIRPSIELDANAFEGVIDVAAEGKALQTCRAPKSIDLELIELFDLMADVSKLIIRSTEQSTETRFFPTGTPHDIYGYRQRRIFEACESLLKRNALEEKQINADAMRFVLGLISGQFSGYAVIVDKSNPSGKSMPSEKTVMVFGKAYIPPQATIVLADATGRLENIEDLTGLPVKNITPTGYLNTKSPIYQVAIDITRKTRQTTLEKLLAAIMLHNPQARKIGVIGHTSHIKNLKKKDSLLGCLSGRICKSAYFGQGIDRASNDWPNECDLLVVLGTPRVSPQTIAVRLIRTAKFGAAARDGRWGERAWEAETVSGVRRIIKGRGYQDPDWRRASEDQVRAALLQAAGRGRSHQESGIPVVVVSTEPVGLPVEDQDKETKILSSRGLELFIWIESQVAKSLIDNTKAFGNFTTGDVIAGMGVPKDRASKALAELAELGYLSKLGHGKWGVTHSMDRQSYDPSG